MIFQGKILSVAIPLGYSILETSGDVLDPISLNVTIKDAVVDPMKYLREFNYGKVSKLPNVLH